MAVCFFCTGRVVWLLTRNPNSTSMASKPFSATSVPKPDPNPYPSPSPKEAYVILPKKKPLKWSTGDAPGEYGGPPLTSKLRKYWGGGNEDPLTATDDFIWNKEFMGRMKRLLEEDKPVEPPAKEEPSGFLSLNRAMSLDSIEIDLSEELCKPSKPVLEQQVEAARLGQSLSADAGSSGFKWRFVPTRREQAKWDRATKAATGGSDVMLRNLKRSREDPKILAARAREQYRQLKQKMQLLTVGIGGIGILSAYVSYSPEIAASFGAGLLGSIFYIRMLGNSVDSAAGGGGAKGLLRGAIGQPRLFVPVILVMIYNRWNGMLVPEYGFLHLDLIPMLVGFFTYKVATFVLAIQAALPLVEKKEQA
ncbi:uncharacterized protein LOC18442134 [Amborella trichopoda]|uniref:uncharacterized protein LOC18442134 n=1 Tax=Amborella trichopoda TaxID=13333 RepID=UPI0009BDD0D8|nr:uncharacterized protein LOC18442134 [Amborella trichopoda]|eukprot:XP_011626259.2 uncharacterized protein LOC18442134 [Amborella trichopoda]